MNAAPPEFDLAICGAGPAGSALALLLAESGADAARIALIDGRPPDTAADARLIAISQGSRGTLERIGAWRDASATPIERIHVSHRGHFGRTLIDARDYAVPALGYVIAYGDLQAQLDAALARVPVCRLRPARASAVTNAAAGDHVDLTLADARTMRARFAVHAEGGLFDTQAPRTRVRDYAQTAITAVVRCALPQPGVAWERFTPEGPLALLPLRQPTGPACALVWCGTPDAAARRLALDEAAFLTELHQAFGDRLGRFTASGPRHAFALGLNATDRLVDGRIFAIGNAAQTLHPVAGQGMNLALRDAMVLAGILGPALAAAHTADPANCAARYLRERRRDRGATIGITDLLPRVFASEFAPLVHARGAALALLDIVPRTRHWLARQMMDGQR